MTFVLEVGEDGLDLPLQLLVGAFARRALPPPQPQGGEQVDPPARRQRGSVVLGDPCSVPASLERDLLQEGGQVSAGAPGVGAGEPAGPRLLLLAVRLSSIGEAEEGAEVEHSLRHGPRFAVAVVLRPPGRAGKVAVGRLLALDAGGFIWSPTPFKQFRLEMG